MFVCHLGIGEKNSDDDDDDDDDTYQKINAIEPIVSALNLHSDNLDVCKNGSYLLNNIVEMNGKK